MHLCLCGAQYLEFYIVHKLVLTQGKTFILLLTLWLYKSNFLLPSFAGARCAFHNTPIIQPFSVASAYTMTPQICPITAWLPTTLVSPSTTLGMHVIYIFREKICTLASLFVSR